MTRKVRFFCSGIATLAVMWLCAATSAAAIWVPLNGIQAQEEAPQFRVIRSDFDAVILKMSLAGFARETAVASGGDFDRILLDGEGFTTEVGKPQLPVIRRLVEIPYGAHAELMIGQTVLRRGSLAEFGIHHRIFPVQPPIEKIPGARESAPFILNEEAYRQTGNIIGELARLSDEGYIRGHHFVAVEIYPYD